jgi:hypothetical protein
MKDARALALDSDSTCSGASAYSSRIYRRDAHSKKRKNDRLTPARRNADVGNQEHRLRSGSGSSTSSEKGPERSEIAPGMGKNTSPDSVKEGYDVMKIFVRREERTPEIILERVLVE